MSDTFSFELHGDEARLAKLSLEISELEGRLIELGNERNLLVDDMLAHEENRARKERIAFLAGMTKGSVATRQANLGRTRRVQVNMDGSKKEVKASD